MYFIRPVPKRLFITAPSTLFGLFSLYRTDAFEVVSFIGPRMDGRGTKRITAQNEQSTGRYSQLTTLLQTAPSRPDSGDYVQDMSAESFGIPSRGKPWQWCDEEGQLNDCL